jgi:ubiquinone/menaquinone biosynthesis C-methylase UbiE
MSAKRGWRDTNVGRIRAARAGDDPGGYPSRRVELARVRPWVRFDDRDVLELGCGDGRLTFQYASYARSVVALDPNAAQVEKAQRRARSRRLAHVRFVVGTAQRPPEGKFDVALFTWSL